MWSSGRQGERFGMHRLCELLANYWVTWLAKVRSSDIGSEVYGRCGERLGKSLGEKIREMFG